MPIKTKGEKLPITGPSDLGEIPDDISDLNEELDSRSSDLNSLEDLTKQRGTPIPALFNVFYKFIQNPSSVSTETFKRMVDTDDTIGAGVDFLVTCLVARLGAYQHPNPEITKFVNKSFEKIQGGFQESCKEMLSATWVGYSVTEKVWANVNEGFIIRKLAIMPPSTILFETDRLGDITADGILQYQRNYNPALFASGSSYLFGFGTSSYPAGNAGGRPDTFARLGDLPFPLRTANSYSYLSIRIPRAKCIHYAFNAQGKFNNPYGRSLLRRAYKWYVMKDAFLRMLSIALDRKGTPLTVVFADPNATILDADKYAGAKKGNQQSAVRADQAVKKAFENVHNDTTIILPGKKGQVYDIDVIPQASNANDFMEAIRLCNQSMLRALLIPALIFTNGDGTGSFALGEAHAKTFDKILDGWLVGFKQALLEQMVYELIAYNFPKSVWEKDGLGDFGKRQLTVDEISKETDIFEKGVTAGIIDTQDLNDLNKMREIIGFEPRTKVIAKPEPEFDDGSEDAAGDEKKKPKENEE